MLKKLVIKNIGGISEAEINFNSGLNVITGESGAGKSSIIRALELITGLRGGAKYIRAGESSGYVCAEFSDNKKISREILNTGRSRIKINNINSGLNECSQQVNKLMRIQSQFAQLELLDADRQLMMLDACLPLKSREILNEFGHVFDEARECVRNLRALKKQRAEIEKEYSNAKDIFELIKICRPEPGLENNLEINLTEITHKILTRERALQSINILTGGLSGDGLLNNLANEYENLFEFMPENVSENLREAINNLNDGLKISGKIKNEIQQDKILREKLENRLGALRKLKRLSGRHNEEELILYSDGIYKNLEWLEKSYTELQNLNLRSNDLKRRANYLAMEIRKARQECALKLSERVNKILQELGMNEIIFNINFNGLQKLRNNGADEIEFNLTDGVRSGKVEKIASGGELSRLLLALQISLPDEWLTPVLIFDEVEAGLGGHAAVLTGMELKKLSYKSQVILVTHEASIAALGDFHILIQRVKNESQIKNISGHDRIYEIARMLSGLPEMTEALEHAKILLNQNQKN